MTDNLDSFQRIVFTLPSTGYSVLGISVAALFFAALTFIGFEEFRSIDLGFVDFLGLAVMVYGLPAVFSAETLQQAFDDYPREWGLLLALCNLVVFGIYTTLMTGADTTINLWNVFWLGLITVYLSNLFVLLLSLGYEHVRGISVTSLLQPALSLVGFHVLMVGYLRIPIGLYITNGLILLFAGFCLVGIVVLFEYLMGANLADISVLNLTSGLIQKREQELDLGYETVVDVQSVTVETSETATFVAPWIHPGPLEGFGGGRVTTKIIDRLNADGNGFFFHVPSTHKSDPADPADYAEILDAVEKPETTEEVSKLLKREYPDATFYGRRYGDRNIVYMDTEFDDYRVSIFKEFLDLESVVLVDLHNQRKDRSRKEVWYGSETARKLREQLTDFLMELEIQPLGEYAAGFSTDLDGRPITALVEEVDGQKTLVFGIEGNGICEEVEAFKRQLAADFDDIVLFTTDTHGSVHDMTAENQLDPDRGRRVVKEAAERVETASAGINRSETRPIRLLGEDYSGLIFSINILIRAVILALILLYIGLVVWIF